MSVPPPVTATTAREIPPMREIKRQMMELLEEFKTGTSSGKMVSMGRLREYVTRQNPYTLLEEIKSIDNEQDINVLIGVGMRGFLYYETIKQKARCMNL